MKSPVILAPIVLGVLASGALAAKVTIKGDLTESVAASDNYFLSQDPTGPTVKWLNTLNLNARADMATTRYELDTHLGYFKYFGPGAVDTSLIDGTPLGVKLHANHREKLTTYDFTASWDRQDLATTLLEETGFSAGRGFVDSFSAGNTITHQLSAIDTLTWSNSATKRTYTASQQTPTRVFNTTGSWSHALNATTKLINSVSLNWFRAEDEAETERLFWTITSGAEVMVSPRLRVSGAIGVALVNAWVNNHEALLAAPAPTSSSGTGFAFAGTGAANGIIGNIEIDYKFSPTTKAVLTAAQAIAPTVIGNLQQTTSVNLLLSRQVNHLSSVSASARFTHTLAADRDTNFLSASVSYERRLTRLTRATLSYRYDRRINNDQDLIFPVTSTTGTTSTTVPTDEPVESNTVTLTVIREFDILP